MSLLFKSISDQNISSIAIHKDSPPVMGCNMFLLFRSEERMELELSWTLWSWRDREASPSSQLPPTLCGSNTTSTSSTPQVRIMQLVDVDWSCCPFLHPFCTDLSLLRSRGLHDRGGAVSAGSRWSCAGPVFGRRRAVSDHDRQQTDEALQRALPHLHQQAGPSGSESLQSSTAAQVSWSAALCPVYAALLKRLKVSRHLLTSWSKHRETYTPLHLHTRHHTSTHLHTPLCICAHIIPQVY